MENSMNDMQRVLDAQKKHFIDEGSPSIELRVDRLNRLKSLIIDNRYDFVDALNEDYGNRSKNTSIMTDAYSIVPDINNAIKNIKKWTKTDKRSSNFPFRIIWCKVICKTRAIRNSWYGFSLEFSCKFIIWTLSCNLCCR
jgi:coniferyl-aldehyde dehydrogenase